MDLPGEAGITSISLADDAPILEIGKNYQWAVILICGNRPNPNDPVVSAWIKRVDESQITQSENYDTKLDKAADYARQGVWYDALSILIAERNNSVNNWNDIWVKYLQSGGLDVVIERPIIGN